MGACSGAIATHIINIEIFTIGISLFAKIKCIRPRSKETKAFSSTFPIQEQAEKGFWDYQLKMVYTVGVLDFIFDDHKDDETIVHFVELKNQHCEVFYPKLKFIYIELPKFTKTLEELETHLEKWLFLFRHLPDLTERPELLEDSIFSLSSTTALPNFWGTPESDCRTN